MGFTGTPAAEYTERAVMARFDDKIIGVGQYNRRPIAGTSRWSEHSWGNALDLHFSIGTADNIEKANGDEVASWLATNSTALGIRNVLWWVTAHFDHIHVDFYPRGDGVPPLHTTGVGRFKYSTGRIDSARIQNIPMEGLGLEEDMPLSPEDIEAVAVAAADKVFDRQMRNEGEDFWLLSARVRDDTNEIVTAHRAGDLGATITDLDDEVLTDIKIAVINEQARRLTPT